MNKLTENTLENRVEILETEIKKMQAFFRSTAQGELSKVKAMLESVKKDWDKQLVKGD